MHNYDLVATLHRYVNALEQQLAQFQQLLLSHRLLAARVFSLPPIEKGHEHDEITRITVKQHVGEAAREKALTHFGRLFMQHQSEKLSTKSAVRLPGVLCIEANHSQQNIVHQQVLEINQLKARLEHVITVEANLPAEARFEFVHTHLPGMITLNAYRNITLTEDADTVNFGWANKNIIKNITAKEICVQLEKSLKAGRSVAPWSREQWAEKVQDEMTLLRQLPAQTTLKIKRPVKVQPIARVWNRAQQKQRQLACPSPLLILCQDATQLPEIGSLPDYDVDKICHRYKPQAQPLYPLIPRLHLFSDCPAFSPEVSEKKK
ncbi:DNA replication terminus site-binding protein [Enterobacteriaceae bacterium LUAb1]